MFKAFFYHSTIDLRIFSWLGKLAIAYLFGQEEKDIYTQKQDEYPLQITLLTVLP